MVEDEIYQRVQMQLVALLKLGKQISHETDLDHILIILADTAKDILNADRCSIFLYDKKNNELWTKVAHGVKEIRIPASKGVAGYTFGAKEVQIVVDAYNDFRFYRDVDRITGYVTKTIVAVPLLNSEGEAIGVFQAINKKDGYFSSFDAELLILIGNYASVSLTNALLYRRLRETQNKIITKISSAAEFKDEDTHRHTKRVGLYSETIATATGLPLTTCQMIRLTAPMHDTGKIGIPDHILLKPGRLDEAEMTIMKTHCKIGYDILYDEEDPVLSMAATIAYQHHERYNGTGYPLGLSKEEIAIESRITAIADVFDALISRRPYKEPWPIEKAKELIRSEAGSHFDPHLVAIFLDNFERIEEIVRENRD
ncbi:MAG: HD domain-containing protein [Campylobacterales bacterium]